MTETKRPVGRPPAPHHLKKLCPTWRVPRWMLEAIEAEADRRECWPSTVVAEILGSALEARGHAVPRG